jgi:hypothetical protein
MAEAKRKRNGAAETNLSESEKIAWRASFSAVR